MSEVKADPAARVQTDTGKVSRKALSASIALHLFILIAGSLSFVFIQKPKIILPDNVPIEISFIEEKLPEPAKPEPVIEKPKPKKVVKKPEPPKAKAQPVKSVKPPQTKPKFVPVEPAKIVSKPKEIIEKARQEQKEEVSFSSVLKNLAGEENPAPPVKEEGPSEAVVPQPVLTRQAPALTLSEQDALRSQLAQCWNIAPGAQGAEDLVVEMQLILNPDATVQSAKIVDNWQYRNNGFYRAAAESAMRAIRNPSCIPLKLPLHKYDQWKNMVIRFDPKEMF